MLVERTCRPPFFSISRELSTRLDERLQNCYPRWFRASGEGRNYLIKKEIEELDKYWNELVYEVCTGDASEMNALKKFNIFDFFDFVDNKMKDRKNG